MMNELSECNILVFICFIFLATKTVFDTPIRVFGTLPQSIFQFCDYMFQDEELEETISRFKELLDISITEECLRLQCERTPGN